VNAAIRREKQIKGWRRDKKIALIESTNPDWEDLSKEWFVDSSLAFGMTKKSTWNDKRKCSE
jgi:hypothetical protein